MKKQHLIPCRECPFRRTSLAGYLGENHLEDFSSLAMSEVRMPCHLKVNYTKSNWRALQQASPQCVGRATLWANTLKLPRDRDLLQVNPDRTNVFNNIREFLAHHDAIRRREIDGEETQND